MKKLTSSIIIILLLLASTMVHASGLNSIISSINEPYTIVEKYEYPTLPGTSKWASFQSRIEKIEACKIPEDVLPKLTTEALVISVMNYPLLVDMVVRDTKLEGFNAINRVFNGLQELVKRSDALIELKKYKTSLDATKIKSNNLILKSVYVEYLLVGFGEKEQSYSIMYSIGTVYTPHGTSVSTLYNLTWADHGITASTAALENEALASAYPNATELRAEYPSYNCNSYAWYSTSTTNNHWINNPSAYMTDGSYTQGNPVVGSKVYYGSIANHSGQVVYVGQGSGPNIGVYSKWGRYGLFSHNIIDCPYTDGSYNCTFWS